MADNPASHTFSVTEINRLVRSSLEDMFGDVSITGEISNLIQHRSGHWYFSLKDQHSELRAAMFKFANQRVQFQPKNGDNVVACGKLSLYEAKGSYQFIIQSLEQAGIGNLHLAFERLKNQLTELGYFDDQLKQAIPSQTENIAVITSPQGAVIEDIKTTLKRRSPWTKVHLLPTPVQGDGASARIAEAIRHINILYSRGDLPVEAIILARGGGSIEDLWCFNERIVADAIHNSALPIVSAVGHETDFTIADFCADARAATPTAAAEMLSADKREIFQQVESFESRLLQLLNTKVSNAKLIIDHLSRQLRSPQQQIQLQAQRLDNADMQLQKAVEDMILQKRTALNQLQNRLALANPKKQLSLIRFDTIQLHGRLLNAIKTLLASHQNKLAKTAASLDAISPLATLQRGYAITTDQNGAVIRSSNQLQEQQKINVRLGTGNVDCTVDTVNPKA